MTDKKTIFKGMLCISLLLSPAIVTAGPYSHLEPLPLIRTSYDVALFNSLLWGESPHLYMVWMPSLKPPQQSAIMIDCEIEYEEYTDEEANDPSWEPKIKSTQWFLKYAVFKTRLKSKNPFDPFQTYDIDPTNDIKRLEINIDDEFASLMTESWLHVLRETRYPTERKPSMVLDGSTYIFKCDDDQTHFYRYYGMTDSSSGVELDDLGRMLISLVKADEQDRELLQKQCTQLASNIINKKAQPDPRPYLDNARFEGEV
jgi:hypothetical protein